MKKTKKRALLSSVAMLVVSAVVLSSATFAWFVAGDSATVDKISMNIKTSSSIQISPDNVNWSAELLQADLEGKFDNSFPGDAKLTAVSSPATQQMPFFDGTLLNTNAFSATTAAALETKIVKFTFWLQAVGENATVRYSTGSALGGTAANAVYVAMQIGTNDSNASAQSPLKYSGGNNSYNPISAETTTGLDAAPYNKIMDVGEGATLGTLVSAIPFSSAVSDIALIADTPIQFVVYMWLEGQDANCKTGTGGVTGAATLDLKFDKL